jgi:hypothetical protein
MAKKAATIAKPATPAADPTPATTEAQAATAPVTETAVPDNINEHEVLVACALTVDTKFHPGQHAKESVDEYLKRLVKVVGSATDDDFNAMPEVAQTWFNTTVEEYINKGNSPLPEPVGFVALATPAAAEKKAAAGAKPAKTAAAPADKLPRPEGVTSVLRKAVIANPEMNIEGILEVAAKNGFPAVTKSTASTIRADTLATIAIIKAAGHWKD